MLSVTANNWLHPSEGLKPRLSRLKSKWLIAIIVLILLERTTKSEQGFVYDSSKQIYYLCRTSEKYIFLFLEVSTKTIINLSSGIRDITSKVFKTT